MKKRILQKNKKQDPKVLTANEFVDVSDIHGNLLYTKSGYVFAYLRLYPINIHLMSFTELENTTRILSSSFRSEKKLFDLLIIPRSVDMEAYLNNLTECYDTELENPNRKMLLNIMIREASLKIMSGNNYEHQFYIRLCEKQGNDAENILNDRIRDFENRYNTIGNRTERVNTTEILRICNLFANGTSSIYETHSESDMIYTPVPALRRYQNGS